MHNVTIISLQILCRIQMSPPPASVCVCACVDQRIPCEDQFFSMVGSRLAYEALFKKDLFIYK